MIAIACLDKKNGIGKDGKLLVSIPDDMKFFREKTKDSIVVMGRKTLYSFKDRAPLKGRINIVLTSNDALKNEYKAYDNIYFVKNEKELDDMLDKYKDKKTFLIGGAKIYNEFIDKCDTAYITKVDKIYDADTFFPELSSHGFKEVESSAEYAYEDIKYKFITYQKV